MNEDKETTGRLKRITQGLPRSVEDLRVKIVGMKRWQRYLTAAIITALLGIYIPNVIEPAGIIAVTGGVVGVGVILMYLTRTPRLVHTWLVPAMLMFFVYPFAALPLTLFAFYFTVNIALRNARTKD